MDVLYQVALADHIRSFQVMYRDAHDEQCLFSELRGDDDEGQATTTTTSGSGSGKGGKCNDGKEAGEEDKKRPPTKLPTYALATKIMEGRIRASALCRLCYGDNSLEMLRSISDLAASYAVQGMWDQVSERLAVASGRLIAAVSRDSREQQLRVLARARAAGAKVACTYRVLRSHAVSHRGQVSREVLGELGIALGELTNTTEEEFMLNANGETEPVSHPTQLIAMLHGFFTRFTHPHVRMSTSLYPPSIVVCL